MGGDATTHNLCILTSVGEFYSNMGGQGLTAVGLSSEKSCWKYVNALIGDYSLATPPDVWKIFDLWIFKECNNEGISQSTNIICENHIGPICFTPKHIKN